MFAKLCVCGCVFTRNVKAPAVVPACIALPVRFALLVPCFHPAVGFVVLLRIYPPLGFPHKGQFLQALGTVNLQYSVTATIESQYSFFGSSAFSIVEVIAPIAPSETKR